MSQSILDRAEDAASQLTISSEHRAAVQEIVRRNPTASPQSIRNNHRLLDPESNPIYTEGDIRTLLQEMQQRSRPTAESRAAKVLAAASQGTERHQAPSCDASCMEDVLLLYFEYANCRFPIEIMEYAALQDVKQLIRDECSIPASTNFRLVCASRTEGKFDVVDKDRPWQLALSAGIREFQIVESLQQLVPVDSSSSLSRQADTASSVSSVSVNAGQDEGRRHFEYAMKVEVSIKAKVAEVISSATFGSAQMSSSVGDLRIFLNTGIRLADAWESLASASRARPDGIEPRERLSWFIAAVVAKLHPFLSQKWHSADASVRTQRAPENFSSLLEFLFALYTLVRPGTSGSPDFILPEMLVELERSLAGFASRAAVRDELLLIRAAASFLKTNWYQNADEVDKPIMRFLEKILSQAIQADLKEALKLAHSSDLPMHLKGSTEFAPLHAYALENVLLKWVRLDSLGRQTFRADLELRSLAPTRLANGVLPNLSRDRLQAPEGPGVSSIKEGTGPPAPVSAKTFTMAGEVFRTHLASWEQDSERKREEQRFVQVAVSRPMPPLPPVGPSPAWLPFSFPIGQAIWGLP